MFSQIKVTVLTPTYNRGYVLPRLYESLCNQTDMAFVWLIVDDGSSDETKSVVEKFENKNFLIEYVYKSNGGKHTAINLGMRYVHTEYTFIVDSDDYLKKNAIEKINTWIKKIAGVERLAGVAGLRVTENDKIVGQFPDNCEYIDCLNSERKQYKLLGDKAEVYKTALLKSHPFPVYDDERFMPESIVWNQFSLEGLKVRWYNECIIVCEYLPDGLTWATKNIEYFKKNYKGYRDEYLLNMKVFKFPFNLSAASVFYARCLAIGKKRICLKNISCSMQFLISLLGTFRYIVGRY